MRQKFLGNLVFLILANLLVKPLWLLGIDRYVQNQAGPALYGAYFAVFNFSFLFHIILDAGINNFNNTEASRDSSFISSNASAILNIKLLFSLLYVAVTVGLACFTSFDKHQYSILFCLMLNLVLLNFILYFRSNIAALQLFRIDSLLSICDRFLAIIFCAVLIWFHPFGQSLDIMHFIFAQTLALAITLLIAITISLQKTKVFNYTFDFTQMIHLLKKSYPFAIIGVLMALYYRLDGVMIEQMLHVDGKEQTGIYAASYRLFDATNMIAYLFATLLLPMFAFMIAKKESVEELAKTAAYILLSGSLLIVIISYFFSDAIMHLLYTQATHEWANIFVLLMCSFAAVAMTYVFGTLLTAGGHLRIFNILSFAGLLMNFSLNLFLIPRYKALGAAWATFITQVFIATFQIVIVFSKYKFSFELKTYLKILLYGILLIATAWICRHLEWNLFVALGMLSAIAALLFFVLKIVPVYSFRLLLKDK